MNDSRKEGKGENQTTNLGLINIDNIRCIQRFIRRCMEDEFGGGGNANEELAIAADTTTINDGIIIKRGG